MPEGDREDHTNNMQIYRYINMYFPEERSLGGSFRDKKWKH
jgi:hypothetical protein